MKDLKGCQIFKNINQTFKLSISLFCVFFLNEAIVVDNFGDVFFIINNLIYQSCIMCGHEVVKIAYHQTKMGRQTLYHLMALTSNGIIFTKGKNDLNAISPSSVAEYLEPIPKLFFRTIKTNSYLNYYFPFKPKLIDYELNGWGTVHRIDFTTENSIKIWGNNKKGELEDDCKIPKNMRLVVFKLIGCGAAHSVGVTTENSIIIWGNNSSGQFGNCSKINDDKYHEIKVITSPIEKYYPYKLRRQFTIFSITVVFLVILISIARPHYFNTILIIIGLIMTIIVLVYFFNFFDEKLITDITINEDSKITMLACGAFHNLVLFENGNVWGWGSNNLGQLGIVPKGLVLRPRPLFSNVKQIVASNNHSLILCHDGLLYACGDNTFAQLGSFEKIQYDQPQKIQTNYISIAAFNSISIGCKIENNVESYDAWGLFNFEEIRKEENENIKRIAKIITKPKPVRCTSFNDFVEKYSGLTYFMVSKDMSSTLNAEFSHDRQIDQELIDEEELLVVNYIFGDEKPVEGALNVHIGDQNKFSVLDKCSVSGNIDISDIKQSTDGKAK